MCDEVVTTTMLERTDEELVEAATEVDVVEEVEGGQVELAETRRRFGGGGSTSAAREGAIALDVEAAEGVRRVWRVLSRRSIWRWSKQTCHAGSPRRDILLYTPTAANFW